MAVQKGRDLLVRMDDGTGAYVAVAGLRARRIAFDAGLVDVTTAESAGRWRELLGGAGPRHASVSGAGLFRDAASDALLRALFFEGACGASRSSSRRWGASTARSRSPRSTTGATTPARWAST